ncbi:MAG: hypothetical protein ACP5E5_14965 [Acidobacteriaceae bacterium]
MSGWWSLQLGPIAWWSAGWKEREDDTGGAGLERTLLSSAVDSGEILQVC